MDAAFLNPSIDEPRGNVTRDRSLVGSGERHRGGATRTPASQMAGALSRYGDCPFGFDRDFNPTLHSVSALSASGALKSSGIYRIVLG